VGGITIQSKSLQLLQRITAAANEAETPDDALQFALDEVCRFMDWPIGHVYLPDPQEGGKLASAGLWHLENARAAANFCLVSEATRFAPGVGLPGRVYQSGKSAWIVDVGQDPNFPRAKLSKNLGVRAGFAFPVLAGMETVGVLEFFSPEAVEPDENTLALMSDVGTQLGRAIERDRAEKELRERERYIHAILDNLVDGVIAIDGRGRIDSVNPAAERIFGYTQEEMVGESLTLLMPTPHSDHWAGRMEEYMDLGRMRFHEAGAREVAARRRDGSEFPMELTVSEFRSGERNLFIGVVRDLTDRKEHERELHQAQRLEAVGQLTGGIAHDFNNVLTALLGNLQIMEGMLSDRPEVLERLGVALEAGRRAAETTKRLMTFARRQPMKPESFDVNEFLPETLKLVRRTLSENIEIEVVYAANKAPVKLDKSQLENAVINLAVNARDAMENGGRLHIETGLETVDGGSSGDLPPGDYVCIAFSDTGAGMAEDVKDKVFEPFFTTKDVGKGTGLGLSMVYGFAGQSGGGVRMESEIGKGTTVELLLPVVRAMEAPEQAISSKALPRGTEHILVVEDDAEVRSFAKQVLETLGYEVSEADTAIEALKLIDQGLNIDLLFSDVIMPGGMSGRVLAEKIQHKCPNAKILLSTGYAEELNATDRSVLSGMELLGKPYEQIGLAVAVRRTLDGK